MTRHYDWQATFSRQVGTQGEVCIVVGAKGIGKTYGLRLACINDYIRHKRRFAEVCRTKEELKGVRQDYFGKLKAQGEFDGYLFKVEGQAGYIARDLGDEDDKGRREHTPWELMCYFVALTAFQTEKKRTYEGIYRFIFDEALIDAKDRYHRYLPDEFLILGNLLDTMSRQQPGEDYRPYRLYLLGNACDLTAPYMRYAGIDRIPDFGYHWFNKKYTLLHYVEPWDEAEREAGTLVGRMLNGLDESDMVFGNRFAETKSGYIAKRPGTARHAFSVRWGKVTFAVWIDYKKALTYIDRKPPKGMPNTISVAKRDATIDYQAVGKGAPYLNMLSASFYAGLLRYDSQVTQELFFSILDFLGIR